VRDYFKGSVAYACRINLIRIVTVFHMLQISCLLSQLTGYGCRYNVRKLLCDGVNDGIGERRYDYTSRFT